MCFTFLFQFPEQRKDFPLVTKLKLIYLGKQEENECLMGTETRWRAFTQKCARWQQDEFTNIPIRYVENMI